MLDALEFVSCRVYPTVFTFQKLPYCLQLSFKLLGRSLATIAMTLAWGSTTVAIDSTWTITSQQATWHDTAPWTNGIPNQAGDIATLTGAGTTSVTALVNDQATIGELLLTGTANIMLGGSGSLHFDNLLAQPRLAAQGVAIRGGRTFEVAIPIGIADGQELHLDMNPISTLRLTGGFAPGSGSVRQAGNSLVTLPSVSSGWTGDYLVESGTLRVEHRLALASSSALIAAPDTLINIVSLESTSHVIPRIVMDGGSLRTNAKFNNDWTRLNTEVELLSDSKIEVPTNAILYLNGGISGPGGLEFYQLGNPPMFSFNHTRVIVQGPTTYSGETIIGPNMRVVFLDSAGLGETSAGTRVLGGYLELNGGGGSESILVEHGQVWLGEAGTPYNHTIQMRGSKLTGGGNEMSAVLSTDVVYSQGAVFGAESSSVDLVIEGGVTGTGSLAIQNAVEVQGEINTHGHLYIRNRAGAILSGKLNLAGEVFVDRRTLRLAGDVGSEHLRLRLAPTFETADAVLFVSADNTVGVISVDPRNSNRANTFDRTRVVVENDSVLTVTDQLRFLGGVLSGKFAGQTVLTKQDHTDGVLENIAGSSFERIDVEGGKLLVRGQLGLMPPEIHLLSHDTSRLHLDNTGNNHGTIYLNNAQGYENEAAMTIAGNTVFEGNLYLGEHGSSLTGLSHDAAIGPNAVIHGGDLTVRGRSPLRILGENHTYTGVTHVIAESLILADGGRLNSTSAIVGSGRFGPSGGRANLILDNSGSMALNERIPEETPVHMNGMILKLIGRSGSDVVETLNAVHATRGIGDFIVEHPSGTSGTTELRIGTLDRQPGSVVQFRTNNSSARIYFTEQPDLKNGLIGGWAISNSHEFATYGPNGVVPYSALNEYTTQVSTAVSSDNVRISSNQELSSDRTINSLISLGRVLDLNGHKLTIESGGLLSGGTIAGPGQLTAGSVAGSELLVTGNFHIEADITDNPYGSVGLTHSLGVLNNSAFLSLSGENTYTGPTVINAGNSIATLSLASTTALPTGGDLILNGGRLQVDVQTDAPLEIGHMELRDVASILPGSGVTTQLRPESVLVESGQFQVGMVGAAPITKVGPLTANFFRSLAAHSGPITVEEGLLLMSAPGPAPIDDDHAITIHSGGQLRTSGQFTLSDRKIRLDGGVLGVGSGVSAPLEVLSTGGILRAYIGSSVFDSKVTGNGPLVVEGGLGSGFNLSADLSEFDGELTLTGGRVFVGANLNYEGHIEVTAGRVSTIGGTPFGSAHVTVRPEGQVNIRNTLDANLYLAGGALRVQLDADQQSPVLSGTLSVEDHSYLFVFREHGGFKLLPRIESSLVLGDGSNLIIAEAADSFSDLKVRQELVIESETTIAGMATLTSFDRFVEIGGTLFPASPDAVLNLVGNDTFDLRASIELSQGNSLTLLENGVQTVLTLSGSGQSLKGNGTFVSDVVVLDGASLSPGNSPGELTVQGDVVLGGGAIYHWEIADALGSPGTDWDLLHVVGDLSFDATPSNPWVLNVSHLGGIGLSSAPLLIASAESISNFDPAAVQIVFPEGEAFSLSSFSDQWVVTSDGTGLYLQVIPEPSTALLGLAIACMAAGWSRRLTRPVC